MHDCWWMMTFAGRYCTCELQLQFFVFTCIIALLNRSVVLVLVLWIRSWSWSCELCSWSWSWSCSTGLGLGFGLVKSVLFPSLRGFSARIIEFLMSFGTRNPTKYNRQDVFSDPKKHRAVVFGRIFIIFGEIGDCQVPPQGVWIQRRRWRCTCRTTSS